MIYITYMYIDDKVVEWVWNHWTHWSHSNTTISPEAIFMYKLHACTFCKIHCSSFKSLWKNEIKVRFVNCEEYITKWNKSAPHEWWKIYKNMQKIYEIWGCIEPSIIFIIFAWKNAAIYWQILTILWGVPFVHQSVLHFCSWTLHKMHLDIKASLFSFYEIKIGLLFHSWNYCGIYVMINLILCSWNFT